MKLVDILSQFVPSSLIFNFGIDISLPGNSSTKSSQPTYSDFVKELLEKDIKSRKLEELYIKLYANFLDNQDVQALLIKINSELSKFGVLASDFKVLQWYKKD